MLKEIHEQPDALKNTLTLEEDNIKKIAKLLAGKEYSPLYLFGCGSSYYIGLSGKIALEMYGGVDAYAMPSSEFYEYTPLGVSAGSVAVGISRSGETTETIKAIDKADSLGALTLGVTNTQGSELARRPKLAITVRAGEEKSVIMTKTFSTQVYAMHLLALHYAKELGQLPDKIVKKLLQQTREIPNLAREVLALDEQMHELAAKYRNIEKFIFLGSGPSYATCLEGSLKLKETSYIHSEAYHHMEFRHGPMAIVDEKTVIISLIPKRGNHEPIVKLLREIKEKDARVLVITAQGADKFAEFADEVLSISAEIDEGLSPTLYIIPLQLFAYYYCVEKGYDPDSPRHLRKVVML